MQWENVGPSLWLYRDSCNVYAAEGPAGMVIVNAGTGAWLDRLEDLPAPVAGVACTHFFRDHSAGAAEAARRGIPVYAPFWEQEQFADPLGLFQRRETYVIYDNVWDLFCPIEPIRVTGWLQDWDAVRIGGIAFEILPSPGVTLGAVSLVGSVVGRRVAFCGEAVHSRGRIARVAPLQYNYNDLPGAVNLLYTCRILRDAAPDMLAPSLGNPVTDAADAAVRAVERSLAAMIDPRPEYRGLAESVADDTLVRVTDHVYRSARGEASTWFVVSTSGKVLSIDYGYRLPHMWPDYPYPRHRRPLLHGLIPLKETFGIDRIDVLLLTHFHDDHVNAAPMLQRLHGTRCWAGENFAHLLADPTWGNFPCTWPEPIRVEPQPLGQPIRWEEYEFTFHPMSGHTRWSTLVSFEADGKVLAATGDQYFFRDDTGAGLENRECMHNHVYRNGASLRSFHESNARLRSLRPDIILPGHGDAYETGPGFFEALDRYANQFERSHRDLLPLGDDDVHFDVDSRAGWLAPYRTRIDVAGVIAFSATVRNPFNATNELAVRLVGPPGWKGSAATVKAPARGEVRVALTVEPPADTVCRRQPVAVELRAGDRLFGQIAEALVTIGHPRF